ncbi:MAG: kinase, partial [Adhaeribacter sp.]|nr:kinase [Adhaeribacter sp.]
MKIALIGKPFTEKLVPCIQELMDDLVARQTKILVGESFKAFLEQNITLPPDLETFRRGDPLTGVNFMLSIGGDGTLLDALTYVGARQIPILGINTGRLGFLATVSYDQIPAAIDALYKGHYSIEDRSLIRADTDQEVFDGINYGLNEFS